MRRPGSLLAIAIAIVAYSSAFAFPEGAPWGAANPDAEDNCSGCHFDYDAIRDSTALTLDGLPARLTPGGTYDFTIRFADPDAVIAGFQMIATPADQRSGNFTSAAENVEFIGAAIRSTKPRKMDDEVSWSLRWSAPDPIEKTIMFYLAVTGSNDDGSPFGDRIHFRTFRLPTD